MATFLSELEYQVIRQDNSRSRKQGNGTTTALFIALIAVAAMAMMTPSTVSAQVGLREVTPKTDFYRVKARYVVKATNEVIQFDVVRPCRAVTARDKSSDSVWMPPLPIEWGSYFYTINPVFPKVTSDHHLIVMRIPNGCYENRDRIQVRTSNGLVPKDLLPSIIWYDDADDPQFGWEYASEDAYASSFAKVSFEGATIEGATAEDFKTWQQQAGVGFRPSKLVTHPFGFTFAQEQGFAEGNRTDRTYPIALSCHGVGRLKLLGLAKELAGQSWPSDHPRFWTLEAAAADGKKEWSDKLFNEVFGSGSLDRPFEDGIPQKMYRFQHDGSIPTRASGGYESRDIRPRIVFPVIRSPYDHPFLAENALQADLYFDVDLAPKMQGFLACYNGSVRGKEEMMPDWQSKNLYWRISGEPVAGRGKLVQYGPPQPGRFFERNEYLYIQR